MIAHLFADISTCKPPHLVVQFLLWDLDGVVLDSVSAPLVGDLLGHQLLQDEQQQLIVVPAERQVAGKRLANKQEPENRLSSS